MLLFFFLFFWIKTSDVSSMYVMFVLTPNGQTMWSLSLFNCNKKTINTNKALAMKKANTDLFLNSIKSEAIRACVHFNVVFVCFIKSDILVPFTWQMMSFCFREFRIVFNIDQISFFFVKYVFVEKKEIKRKQTKNRLVMLIRRDFF